MPSQSTVKSWEYPYNPGFFVFLAENSFDTLTKHKGAAFISESLPLDLKHMLSL